MVFRGNADTAAQSRSASAAQTDRWDMETGPEGPARCRQAIQTQKDRAAIYGLKRSTHRCSLAVATRSWAVRCAMTKPGRLSHLLSFTSGPSVAVAAPTSLRRSVATKQSALHLWIFASFDPHFRPGTDRVILQKPFIRAFIFQLPSMTYTAIVPPRMQPLLSSLFSRILVMLFALPDFENSWGCSAPTEICRRLRTSRRVFEIVGGPERLTKSFAEWKPPNPPPIACQFPHSTRAKQRNCLSVQARANFKIDFSFRQSSAVSRPGLGGVADNECTTWTRVWRRSRPS
jgi:hypothetical protein